MLENHLDFVLVENHDGFLEGIFTLRDLLRVHRSLHSEYNMDKPIRAFMSKPVITLPAEKINEGPQLMVSKRIRHLPIHSDEEENSKIIGVIDIESLLAYSLGESHPVDIPPKDISVYSPNGALLRLLKKTLDSYEAINLEKLWSSKLKTEIQFQSLVEEYDLICVDILELRDLNLALHLAPLVEAQDKKMITLIDVRSFKQEDLIKASLSQLTEHRGVKLFHKPFKVHDIVTECLI